MGRLAGKTAVITGGNSGMGRATAGAMAREGATVLIFGRNAPTLEATRADIGRGCIALAGDVGDLDDLDRLATTAQAELGKVDIVFANAGGGHEANFAPLGLRVNTICPGFINGPVYDGMDMAAINRDYISRVPLSRMGEGSDIAYAAIYLASDEAAYVTGIELVVDGGHTLVI